MAGATPRYNLPYPTASDPTDVEGAIQALATAVDSGIGGAVADSPYRIIYSSVGGWPSRPSTSVVSAGLAEYVSAIAGAPNPTDMQLGDTLDVASSAPANTVFPAITGSAVQGSVLTASTGTWSGSPSYSYQWYSAGVAISGANASTYTCQSSDIGNPITVQVLAANASGASAVTSAATAAVLGLITFDNVVADYTGTYTDATVSSSTGELHGGNANSVLVTCATTTAVAGLYGLEGTTSEGRSVAGGTEYTFTVYVYPTSANRQAGAGVFPYDSGGDQLSYLGASIVPVTQNAWNALQVTVTMPSNAATVRPIVQLQDLYGAGTIPSGDEFYFSAT